MLLNFTFDAEIWLWQGNAAWTFITVPAKLARQIQREAANPKKPGGTIPVTAQVGYNTWKTSLSKENPRNTYAPSRPPSAKKEQLREGQTIEVSLLIETREEPT